MNRSKLLAILTFAVVTASAFARLKFGVLGFSGGQ
jgi:hypothetical protein